ncbi:hypothetical protein V6N13_072712 [Hibiscus sabdariffa]
MIRFTMQDNQWTVSHFISEHNHELATPSKRHLLRSARSIPTAKANAIDSMVSAGIRPADVYTYMSNEVRATSSLTEFVFEFENLVARWRSSEAEKDFQCKNGSIARAIKDSSILTHASKVYTHEIYKQFQKEFLDGIPLIWREVAQNDKIYTFEVRKGENSSRVRAVQFNTKNVRRSLIEEISSEDGVIVKDCENKSSPILNPPCVRPKGISNARLKGHLEKIKSKASKLPKPKNVRRSLIEEISSEDGVIVKDCENKSSPILNPPCVRPKGISNARLKGHLEKIKSKASKLPKPKKRKQSTIEEHLNAPTSSTQSSGNFAIPLMMRPLNNIYTSSYNSMQQRIDTTTPTSYQVILRKDEMGEKGRKMVVFLEEANGTPEKGLCIC